MNKKAIALMSGGLDSTLAVRLMVEQGIEVTALNFKSPFCLCDGGKAGGCKTHARTAADQIGIGIKVIHKELDYLKTVRSPKFGYGTSMNPCVDCRIYTFRSAKKFMEETGASFIITGEVLAQRPMSQKRDPMFLIERESGLEGLILRPLSAKMLPPTLPEKMGIVDRDKLLTISGRSRKEQIKIADHFKIEDYPCASGGCLLTDKHFGVRLKDHFNFSEQDRWTDIKLLMLGKHFRLKNGSKVIIGRNEDENRRISVLGRGGILLNPVGFKGPTAYAAGAPDEYTIDTAGGLILRFSKFKGGEGAEISCTVGDEKKTVFISETLDESEVQSMWVR